LSTISEAAKQLTMIEAHTLTGQYEPNGAAACAIYEHLQEAGLVNRMGEPTLFGRKVKDYIINERRKNLDVKTS
jgi:hypothetical protein